MKKPAAHITSALMLITVSFTGLLAQSTFYINDLKRKTFPAAPVDNWDQMEALPLPEIKSNIKNTLFNDCYYCQEENRIWYASVKDLYIAASRCGLDYLETRIDQIFRHKDVSILTRVYLSLFRKEVIIDSVLYIKQDSTRSIKKVITSGTTRNKQNLFISGQYTDNPASIGDKKPLIDSLLDMISDFRSLSIKSRISDRFNYTFCLNGMEYNLENNLLVQKPVGECDGKTGPVDCRCYYRLGKYKYDSDCGSKNNVNSDIKLILRDHYIFNQCIIDYEISSESDLSQIHFFAENLIDTTIGFKKAKRVSSSVSVGFGTGKKALDVEVTDVHGNVIQKKIVIFQKFDDYNKKRNRQKCT